MGTEKESDIQSYVPIKFFSVSTWKLVILSITTLGFYHLFWFYKNWKAIKEAEKSNIGLFWRTWWVIFFIESLFKKIVGAAKQNGFKEKINPFSMALFYVLLMVAGNVSARGEGFLFNMLWVLSLFSVIPLIQIQKAINFNNKIMDPDYIPSEKIYPGELVVVIIGGIIFLLAIAGLFFNDLPAEPYLHEPFPSSVS